MEEERSGGVRRRSRAEVEVLVAEYAASGLRRKAFCAGRGMAVATLDGYRRRLRQTAVGPRLLAVELHTAREKACPAVAFSGMAVGLGKGGRIELGGSIDREFLAELIGVVERA